MAAFFFGVVVVSGQSTTPRAGTDTGSLAGSVDTEIAGRQPAGPNNIVFLLDISSSMARGEKMQLLHKSVETLVRRLGPNDKVHLLTFGNVVELRYSMTAFSNPDSLMRILQRIRSTSSATNINGGIQSAYEQAGAHFIKGGSNEVLLITDGEFLLNKFTVDLVLKAKQITLTAVVIGDGAEAARACFYIRENLHLPLITLVDEQTDTDKLLVHFVQAQSK